METHALIAIYILAFVQATLRALFSKCFLDIRGVRRFRTKVGGGGRVLS